MTKYPLKKIIKSILKELMVITIFALISIVVFFAFNLSFKFINKPPVVSVENQKAFTYGFDERYEKEPITTEFGDLYAKHLGTYKYDKEITSMSGFNNINNERNRILKYKSLNYSKNISLILLIFLILLRYIVKLKKWLNED